MTRQKWGSFNVSSEAVRFDLEDRKNRRKGGGGGGRDALEGRRKLSPVLEPMFLERETKGVLASKTNSYPQQPLSAVFFADNLLLAA